MKERGFARSVEPHRRSLPQRPLRPHRHLLLRNHSGLPNPLLHPKDNGRHLPRGFLRRLRAPLQIR